MKNPPSDELFAERPVRSDFARSGGPSYGARRFITVFVFVLVVSVGLYVEFGHGPSSVPQEIPTIKAEGVYKQRPEQPGGIDIPHQDVQVYQALDNNGAAPASVEHLLPPPEDPHPVEAAPTPSIPVAANTSPPLVQDLSAAPVAPSPVATTVTPVAATAPVPVAAPAIPVVAATSPVVKSVPPVVEKASAPPIQVAAPVVAPMPVVAPAPARVVVPAQAPAKLAVAPSTPASVVTKPKPTSIDDILKTVATQSQASGTSIQLASIPDQASAEQALQKLQTKYASVLGSHTLRLTRADLGAKGIYYRVQSQPMSEDKAKSLCAAIKNLNGGCLLVRP